MLYVSCVTSLLLHGVCPLRDPPQPAEPRAAPAGIEGVSSPAGPQPAGEPMAPLAPVSYPIAEARAIIERAEAAYMRLRSYRDTVIIRHEAESALYLPRVQVNETRLEFRYAHPNLFVLKNEHGGAYCDGTRLWLHDAHSGTYAQSPAPPMVRLEDLDRCLPAVHFAAHPVARILLSGSGSSSLQSWSVDELTARDDEPRDGEPGHRVHAIGRGDIPGPERSAMSLWFRGRTGLLEEIAIDLTGAFRSANEGAGVGADGQRAAPAIDRVTVTTRVADARMDEPVTADDFAFHPGAGDRVVDEIASPFERDRAVRESMIGRAAPALEGRTLDGARFSLADDGGGRVVALFFWDTGCVDPADALPRVGAIAARFADQPVLVLGVNLDRTPAQERVRTIIARDGASIGQIMDGEGAAARSFALTGFPCTVLIDKEGVVRAINPGPVAGREDAIASDIGALLRRDALGD